MILVIIATSIILTGEPTETGGDSGAPAAGTKPNTGGTKPQTTPATTDEAPKTETEIDQIIQSELDNINKDTATTPATQSTVDTGTTPAMGDQA